MNDTKNRMHHLSLSTLRSFGFAVVGLVLGLTNNAWADPPTLAGRIADITGVVWLYDPDNRAWEPMSRNQTVAQGDRLHTDASGRVNVRIGSTGIWLDGSSDVLIAQLDDDRLVLQLDEGRMGLQLQNRESVIETTVRTRQGRVLAEAEGLFRIEQLDQITRLATLQGRARFESDRMASAQIGSVREGEQADFRSGDGARLNSQRVASDPFNNWLLDQESADSSSYGIDQGYVSSEMTGVEDLDRYGRWEQGTEYGNIWYPTKVARDWVPYRDGSWVWSRNWGWTWVDEAPWGFAPFHYGRWVTVGGRWAWAPGSYERRPVYAPALVTWSIGWQSRSSNPSRDHRPPIGAWLPLPPRQAYVPNYSHSPSYANRVNNWSISSHNDRNRPDTNTSNYPGKRPGGNGLPPPNERESKPRDSTLQPRFWDNDGPNTAPAGQAPPRQRPIQQQPQYVPAPVQPVTPLTPGFSVGTRSGDSPATRENARRESNRADEPANGQRNPSQRANSAQPPIQTPPSGVRPERAARESVPAKTDDPNRERKIREQYERDKPKRESEL